jgi:hypothetical protein
MRSLVAEIASWFSAGEVITVAIVVPFHVQDVRYTHDDTTGVKVRRTIWAVQGKF